VRVQNEWGGGEVVWSRERIGVRGEGIRSGWGPR
jgi:hypothetical protein